MAYATVEELETYLGVTVARATLLLTRASRDVDRALLTAVYDTTDPDVIEALRDATCEQVAGYLDSGDLTGTGATPPSTGFTIGKVSVQRAQSGAGGSSGQASKMAGLWPQAYLILQQAGLTGHEPQERGWYGLG